MSEELGDLVVVPAPADYFVAECPLSFCNWRSDPRATDTSAVEDRRAHLATHDHGSLVKYAVNLAADPLRYTRQ